MVCTYMRQNKQKHSAGVPMCPRLKLPRTYDEKRTERTLTTKHRIPFRCSNHILPISFNVFLKFCGIKSSSNSRRLFAKDFETGSVIANANGGSAFMRDFSPYDLVCERIAYFL